MSKRKESGDLYRVVHKEGTHLASSNDTDGAFRGNLLDDNTNKPVGNAEWVKVDKCEYDYGVYYEYQESNTEVELSEEQKEMAKLSRIQAAIHLKLFIITMKYEFVLNFQGA